MSERYTRRDATNAFERLADAVGAKVADGKGWKLTDKRREGAWTLDHNGVYGGYVIEAYVPDSPPRDGRPQAYTAVTRPLGDLRMSAREFAQTCHFAARAVEMSRGKRRRSSR